MKNIILIVLTFITFYDLELGKQVEVDAEKIDYLTTCKVFKTTKKGPEVHEGVQTTFGCFKGTIEEVREKVEKAKGR